MCAQLIILRCIAPLQQPYVALDIVGHIDGLALEVFHLCNRMRSVQVGGRRVEKTHVLIDFYIIDYLQV